MMDKSFEIFSSQSLSDYMPSDDKTDSMSRAARILLLTWCVVFLAPPFAWAPAVDPRELLEMIQQMEQLKQQREDSESQRLVRPTPQEREAVAKLLQQSPRPKTLNEADVKFLTSLLEKPAWLGTERRIMHDIWKEVTGKELSGEEAQGTKSPSDAP